MIHIKKQDNSLNKQNDTGQFPDIYLPFIKITPPDNIPLSPFLALDPFLPD